MPASLAEGGAAPSTAVGIPAALQWDHICYDIPLKGKAKKAAIAAHAAKATDGAADVEKRADADALAGPKPGMRRILHDISGHVDRGEIVAILGASGAGKTTLLNIISARVGRVGTLSGSVLFDGKPRNPASWKRTLGFVEQDDLLMDQLTVEETLDYAARLRLPNKLFTKEQKRQRVADAIDVLRLDKCRHTKVGSSTERGISGGERKRTSIGQELVTDVAAVALDEPTSGLDSNAAYTVVSYLCDVARDRNIPVLQTIHQPSLALWNLHTRVMVLARGCLIYDDDPRKAEGYFTRLGYPKPRDDVNIADHVINLAENAERTDEGERRIDSLIQSWADFSAKRRAAAAEGRKIDVASEANEEKAAEAAAAGSAEVGAASTPSASEDESASLDKAADGGAPTSAAAASAAQARAVARGGGSGGRGTETPRTTDTMADVVRTYEQWPISWWEELALLSKRNALQVLRNPLLLVATVGQVVVLLILLGFAFFRLGTQQADVLPRVGLLFLIPVNSSFNVLFAIVALLPLSRAIMKRERAAGSYRTTSFLFSKIVVEVPSQILQRALFYVVLYWMTGLRMDAGRYFIFLGVNFVQLITTVAQGLMIGSVSPTVELGNVLAPLINVIFLIYAGNVLPRPPPWFIYFQYLSPLFYTYSALAQNEMRGLQFSCEANSPQCYPNGDAVLSAYNLEVFPIAGNVGFLFALALLFTVLAYLGLRFTARPRFRYS